MSGEHPPLWRRIAELAAPLGSPAEAVEPSLTVVMRTTHSRPAARADALLSLAGQSDGRFELLLVAHDADPVAAEVALAEQPSWLRQRARVLTAEGGTRSRPLNVGWRAATGTHVAFLDDDDLVFGHWVETLLSGAAAAPGMVVRSIAAVQDTAVVDWPDGTEGFEAAAWPSTPYPPRFSLAEHVRVNLTPFMAFAFPREVIAAVDGVDESLEVCEDWDLVLRAAALTGVHDTGELTAIYRMWREGNSYRRHSDDVWERDRTRVLARLDELPIILPPGAASELGRLVRDRSVTEELEELRRSSSWRLTAPWRAAGSWARRVRRRLRRG